MSHIAPPRRPGTWARLERALVVLIAVHSTFVGLGALLLTEWGVRFGGFDAVSPLFFVRQVGVFHVVVAMAYLVEFFLYRGVTILLATKATAVVFLASAAILDSVPWIVPVSAVGDGLMALAVLLVHRAATRSTAPS